MCSIRSLKRNVLSDDGIKYWTMYQEKKATFKDNELQIESFTEAHLTSINLSKYNFFSVNFRLSSPSNDCLEFGLVDKLKGFYIHQNSQNALVSSLWIRVNGATSKIKEFSTNFYSETNFWHQITIEKRGVKTTCRIDKKHY